MPEDSLQKTFVEGQPGHFAASTLVHRYEDEANIHLKAPSGNAQTDTDDLRDALTQAKSNGYANCIQARPGEYLMDSSVIFDHHLFLEFKGSAYEQSSFKSVINDNSKIMFTLANCQKACLKNFALSSQTPLAYFIDTSRVDNSNPAPSANRFIDLEIDGHSQVKTAFGVGRNASSSDANNDFMLFKRCNLARLTENGWSLNGTQAYGTQMIDCHCETTQHTILCNYSTFKWSGGASNAASVSDFAFLGWNGQPTILDNLISEGSHRFIDATVNLLMLQINGGRVNCGAYTPDGDDGGYYFMKLLAGGAIVEARGMNIEDAGVLEDETTYKPLQIYQDYPIFTGINMRMFTSADPVITGNHGQPGNVQLVNCFRIADISQAAVLMTA